jgi:outer membrane lipoprotein-sorting protein
MRRILSGKSVLCLAAALALIACVPACYARSGSKVDKHAQKIEKKLARYKTGTLLHLQFSNATESSGTLDTLSDTSFSFNNTDTNAKETHLYGDVTSVEKGKQYIGEGSAPKHHIHIF